MGARARTVGSARWRAQIVAIAAVLWAVFLGVRSDAHAGGLSVFVWHGYKSPGVLRNADFQVFFKGVFPGQNYEFKDCFETPAKDAILQGLEKAQIVYANTHSGYLKRTSEHIIKVGTDEYSDAGRISAAELRQWYARVGGAKHMARLVVISGCDILGPPPAACTLTIPDALAFRDGEKGRALIGFPELTAALHGDRFFRVFFARWMAPLPNGTYRTLAKARDEARDFIKDWGRKFGDDETMRRRHYMNPQDAATADDIKIRGDDGLSLPDLSRPLPDPAPSPAPRPGPRAP